MDAAASARVTVAEVASVLYAVATLVRVVGVVVGLGCCMGIVTTSARLVNVVTTSMFRADVAVTLARLVGAIGSADVVVFVADSVVGAILHRRKGRRRTPTIS